jgi:outer membrane protein TolC
VRALRLVQYLSGPTLVIGLIGCTVGPDYQSPELKEEARRSASDGGSVPSRTIEGAVDVVWWKSFRDLELSSLVERLAAQNLDLKTAAERVVQSVAQRQVAASQGLPHAEGQSSTIIIGRARMARSRCSHPRPARPWNTAYFMMA